MKNLLKNKKLMIALAVLVVIVVIFAIVRRRKKAKESDSSGTTPNSVIGSLPMASYPLRPYSLTGKYTAEAGSYGQQIAVLQRGLNQKYKCQLDIDGKFGPKTTQALCDNVLCPEENLYTEAVYIDIISKFPV